MNIKHNEVHLIYIDKHGECIEDSQFLAVGLNGLQVELADEDWVDLPAGADIMALPGRLPLGYALKSESLEVIEAMTAVAAILPMGHTRTLLPGYEMDSSQELPLFGYTAVGSVDGKLKVAAVKTDEELKWNPVYYNTGDLQQLVDKGCGQFPENRIIKQLAKCALEYHCLTAQNIFYQRWEAGIPVSPRCNADCRGCISLQPAECCPSPQSRIDFIPSQKEVTELAVNHLENAADAIISFGQGCEGEPSLQRKLLTQSIREIRKNTRKGTININTNAGYYEAIAELVDAGLDGIRVSLFSAAPESYRWYHRPQSYQFDDVKRSLNYASEHEVNVAINLLFYPGFTNQPRETEAFFQLLTDTRIDQVQLRNLNLDPEKLTERLLDEELESITKWIADLQKAFPNLSIGNYTRPHEPRDKRG